LSTAFAEADPRTTTPIYDLSETGVLVETRQIYPIGTRIELRFVVIPDAPELFVHTGCVTRHSRNPPGMGVEFDPLTNDVRGLIYRILEHAQQGNRRRGRQRVTFNGHGLQTKKV
jgi:hypothetical protein